MSYISTAMIIGGSFALAMGAGVLMQQHEASANGAVILPFPAGTALSVAQPANPGSPVPIRVSLTDADSLPNALAPTMPRTGWPTDRARSFTAPGTIPGQSCAITLTAEPTADAMAVLSLSAPCQPKTPVTIHHRGMMFSLQTDAHGHVNSLVPALAENAHFIASFADHSGAVASTQIPGFDRISRVAVQWQGETARALHIHARLNDAAYCSDGDVSRSNPGAPGDAAYLVSLGGAGENPFRVEVLTVHEGTTPAITVEAHVTAENCGQDIAAQSLVKSVDADMRAVDMMVTMPGCDSVGAHLVLPNLLPAQRMALN